MANQPIASRTLEESFTDALNIEGTFFERRCQYEISQAQNWNVRLYDHPVEFPPPYDATLAPLTQKSDLDIWAEHIADNLKLSLLIECKKHNPNLSDWVFFVSPISQSPLIRIIDINPPVTSNRLEDNLYWSARRSFWPLVTNLGFTDQALELKDDYKRWKNSQQNNGKNKQQQQFERAVNTSIHKASSQIALGTQAVIHQEQLEAEHLNMQVPQRPRPYRLQVFLPTIVTTANLWTCEFKAADVNLSTGEIDLGKVNYKKVSHLIYSFPLPSDLQYHPGDSRYQHREAKELEQMAHMAILVVQSAALPDVLTQLPSLMDNSSIKELKLTLS